MMAHDLQNVEWNACNEMLDESPHTRMHVLPNHHIGEGGDMCGFLFQAHKDDYAAVLPFRNDMYACSCMYECNYDQAPSKFDRKMLSMLNNIEDVQKEIASVLSELESSPEQEASLSCMPDSNIEVEDILPCMNDSFAWRASVPAYVGIHHAFIRSKGAAGREHKIFIVVSGTLVYAGEELFNLWHDTKTKISAQEFAECAEMYWLREAVVRNHNRVACLVSERLGLGVRMSRDFDAPNVVKIAIPTTVTRLHDMRYAPDRNVVEIVNHGCFTDLSFNGILFDTKGLDGFLLLEGDHDSSNNMPYGAQHAHTSINCMPSTSAMFSEQFRPTPQQTAMIFKNEMQENVMGINELFMTTVSKLGFNRNNSVIALMQVAAVLKK